MKIEDVIRFFSDSQHESTCPVCGKDDWTVNCVPSDSEDEFTVYSLPQVKYNTKKNSATFLHAHFVTIPIECDSCGYIRLHGIRQIMDWIKNHPVKPTDNLEHGDA